MRHFIFSLVVTAVVFKFGCSTENPLCTDNFCVEGEIYPRSELAGGQEFSELAVDDAAVFATLAGTPATKKSTPPATFITASPPTGLIPVNSSITVVFDNKPTDVTVSAGTVRVAGKIAMITGPFPLGPLALTVTWADGALTFNYTVTAPDTDPPTVTGGTVSDGDKDVDPEPINSDAKIELEFSENVAGNVALQTEGGDNVGWLGKVEGNKATLELVKGKHIGNETTYVIVGKVSDAAGNSTDIRITFVTTHAE